MQPEELGLIGDGAARAGGGRARRAADDDDRGGELSGLPGGHIRAGPHGPHARPGAPPGCGRLLRGGARLDATRWQAQHAAGSAMAAAQRAARPRSAWAPGCTLCTHRCCVLCGSWRGVGRQSALTSGRQMPLRLRGGCAAARVRRRPPPSRNASRSLAPSSHHEGDGRGFWPPRQAERWGSA